MRLFSKCICSVAIVFFLLIGCTTKVTNSWIKSDHSVKKYGSNLVAGVAKEANNRILWENVMADHLRQNGVSDVVTLAQAIPGTDQPIRQDVINYVNANDLEGVLVTRLVDVKKESVYYPPSGSFYSGGQYAYYSSFPTYYRHAYNVDYRAGQRMDNTVVVLETTLYDSATQDLIWSMSSETFSPTSVNQLAKEVGRKIIQKLKKDKLI